MNSHSLPIPVILAILHGITLKFTTLSLKITIDRENYHSPSSRFTQIVICEITFMLFSRKICSLPIPTRPGTRTFLQVPDPSRPEVKNPYPSDPAYKAGKWSQTDLKKLGGGEWWWICNRQGPTGRVFLLRDGTGRVLAKKFGYQDGSGRVVRRF